MTSEQLRANLRQKAPESLFYTAQVLCGYNSLTDHLHYEMSHVLENASQYRRVLMCIPRNHYKTSLGTISYPVWRGLRDPNHTGLVITNTATNAQHLAAKIRATFEGPLIRPFFPERDPKKSKRWNRDELCLPREADWPEATWEFAGWETHVTGRHYDYVVMDDLVDEETYQNPELMKKLVDRFEQREGLLRPPVHEGVIIVIMNHWSSIDLACYILDRHPEYYVYYRQAIEGGAPIFPEKYSLEWLLRKQKSDPFTFSNQFMNNPVDPDTSELPLTALKEYKREPKALVLENGERIPLDALDVYGACDLRHSIAYRPGERMTSRNAIVIIGVDYKSRRYLLDEYAARDDPGTFLKNVLRLHKQWHPIKIGIEPYGYQKCLKPLADEFFRTERDRPNLYVMKHDMKTDSDGRIRGGARFFLEDRAWLHRTHIAFKDEWATFPNGRTKDVLTAWAWAQTLVAVPAEEEEVAREQAFDREYLARLHPTVGI